MPGSPDLRSLADEDLMQLVRRGDPRAFEVVYERHSGAAFSLAYRMVGRGNVAEDVVQEAFLSIWRSGARYERARGSVRTWVLGIVHHRAIDQLRRSSVHDKRRASDEGLEERLEVARAHRQRGRAPRGGRHHPLRDGHAARRAVARDRARLLRRLHPHRDRRDARDAGRHREGPDAARAGEAAQPSAHAGDAVDMSTPAHDHERGPTRSAPGCWARCPRTRPTASAPTSTSARSARRTPRRCRSPPTRCPRRPSRARRRPRSRTGSWPSSRARPSCCSAAGPGGRPPAAAQRRSWLGRLSLAARARDRAWRALGARLRRRAGCSQTAGRRRSPRRCSGAGSATLEVEDGHGRLVAERPPRPAERPRLPGVARQGRRGARADRRALLDQPRRLRRRSTCPLARRRRAGDGHRRAGRRLARADREAPAARQAPERPDSVAGPAWPPATATRTARRASRARTAGGPSAPTA